MFKDQVSLFITYLFKIKKMVIEYFYLATFEGISHEVPFNFHPGSSNNYDNKDDDNFKKQYV